MTKIRWALFALALGCSAGPEAPSPPAFRPTTIVGMESALVDPAAGATLTLGGATLRVPPGALAEEAVLTLVETQTPVGDLGADSVPMAGQVPLSDSAFTVASDREVQLTMALELDLPFDRARLPSPDAPVRVSGMFGGFVVPQTEARAVSGDSIAFVIDAPRIPEGLARVAPAMGSGTLPFTLVAGALILGNPQALLATADGAVIGSDGFGELTTQWFALRYRGADRATATRVGEVLERARPIFHDEMGMQLPRVLSSLSRYQVVLVEFTDVWGGTSTGGFTLAGSWLMNGTSYVNTNPEASGNDKLVVAPHEYWHAVSWGAMTRWVPNGLATGLDPNHNWLLEGTAALNGGRVGAPGAGLRIDPGLGQHPPRLRSIFALRRVNDPPEDVAQELFFYIERELGTTDHYAPMFQALRTDFPTGTETSVAAVASVLLERGASLGGMYSGWVRDLYFDDPSSYGADALGGQPVAVGEGSPRTLAAEMPPLSHERWIATVAGDSRDDRSGPADVRVQMNVAEGTELDVVTYVATDAGVVELFGDDAQVLEDFRTDADRDLSIVVVNQGVEDADRARIELTVELVEEQGSALDATRGIVVVRNIDDQGNIVGRDLASGDTWSIWERSPGESAFVQGATPDGTILVSLQPGGSSGGDRIAVGLLRIPDYGRGAREELVGLCGGSLEDIGFADIADNGDVYFLAADATLPIGEVRQVILQVQGSTCRRLPTDLRGDGPAERTGVDMIRLSDDGAWLAVADGDMFFVPTAGGAAIGPRGPAPARAGASVKVFRILPDGSGAVHSADLLLRDAPSAFNALEVGQSRARAVLNDSVIWPTSDGATQLRIQPYGQPSRQITLPPTVRLFSPLISLSPNRDRICFPAIEEPVDGRRQQAFCAPLDGSFVERVAPFHGGEAQFWPDAT